MKKSEIFAHARHILASGWCQRVYARGSDGRPVGADDPRAVKWCATGALILAMKAETRSFDHMDPRCAVPYNSLVALVDGPVCYWNDAPGRKKVEVLALFDRAIELAEYEESL